MSVYKESKFAAALKAAGNVFKAKKPKLDDSMLYGISDPVKRKPFRITSVKELVEHGDYDTYKQLFSGSPLKEMEYEAHLMRLFLNRAVRSNTKLYGLALDPDVIRQSGYDGWADYVGRHKKMTGRAQVGEHLLVRKEGDRLEFSGLIICFMKDRLSKYNLEGRERL